MDQQHQLEALKVLAEAAYNALLLVDEDQQVLWMNSAACTLFNVSPVSFEAPGRSVISLTRHHEIEEAVRQAFREEEAFVSQVKINALAFRVRALKSRLNGECVVAVAFEDVSELQRLGRARRDMVANISHELRTPITSIKLLIDTLMRSQHPFPPEEEAMMHKIAAETEVLQQMAQELLDLAMIESGRLEMRMVPVRLDHIAQTVVALFSERAQQKNLELKVNIPEEMVVLADPEQIARVLRNLIHNAIKFTPQGGSIKVSVRAKHGWAKVRVTDSGPGIPVEERERIFERFYRGERARHTEGTGLGLAIAKHIVNAHGGSIWAQEPPKRQGTRICFTLPLAEDDLLPRTPPQADAPGAA